MDVTVEAGDVKKILGNKDHPLTCGVLCKKGLAHLERHSDPHRLTTPLLRQGSDWVPLTSEEGVQLLAEKLRGVDPKTVLYYTDSGHNGISKNAASLFFSHLGPVTTHRGSLCWDAGNYGLKNTIGSHTGVHYSQIQHADVVVLWGRNAKDTNPHLYMHIKRLGKPVIYIDPICTSTAKSADEYYQIRPNSDGMLATAIAKLLHQQGRLEVTAEEESQLLHCSMDDLSVQTGLSLGQLEQLASHFNGKKRVITYIGYGLQRYRNGATTVEAIIQLHFLTGNVNRPGCGFHFSDKRVASALAKPYRKEQPETETFVKSTFGAYVKSRTDWRVLLVDKSNPVVQLPHTQAVMEALGNIPFKVGIDLFMTDTMAQMDLVFPAPSMFECSDVVATSMFSPYLQYTQECVTPPANVLPEYVLFQQVAARLGIKGYPSVDLDTFLYQHVEPVLEARGVAWSAFKTMGWMDPESDEQRHHPLVWTDRLNGFSLATKKNQDPSRKDGAYRLITPHWKDSLHSQGYRNVTELPVVYMNEDGYQSGEVVLLSSPQGSLRCRVDMDKTLQKGLLYIYEGYWKQSGIVNTLTIDDFSDQGDQAAYYDTFVNVVKVKT
jgi:anaerobic selenocysteine-containing dehydrogenase